MMTSGSFACCVSLSLMIPNSVTRRGNLGPMLIFICPGLEHHVPQLVDLRAAAVGLSHLDPARKVTAWTCSPTAATESAFKRVGGTTSTAGLFEEPKAGVGKVLDRWALQ